MLESLFIANSNTGHVLIEKHWRGIVHPNVVEAFFKNYITNHHPEEALPVIATNQYLLAHILKGGLVFLGAVSNDVSPLVLVEFLHRIVDVLAVYVGEVTEFNIKENVVTIYQLLEEMVDYGFPLITDSNTLKDVVAPATIIGNVITQVTGVSRVHSGMLTGGLSNVPWRKTGIKYTNNEIYFDVVEEVDAIIERDGTMVSCEVNGSIMANCRLSGMPELVVTFSSTRFLEDYSFHPCVKYKELQQDNALTFIPPDGKFKLMSYRASLAPTQRLPISLRSSITPHASGGTFELSLLPHFITRVPLENIQVLVKVSKGITHFSGSCNFGKVTTEYHTQKLVWKVGKLTPKDPMPTLTGTYASSTSCKLAAAVDVGFELTLLAISGLKVESLRITNERYRPYKGVRSLTKAGHFQIRI